MHHISFYRYLKLHVSNYSKILPIQFPQYRLHSSSLSLGRQHTIINSLLIKFLNISFLDKVVLHFPFQGAILLMSQISKWPTITKHFNHPLSSHMDNRDDLTEGSHSCHQSSPCCHTEQRVAICCTLPMSIRSCLMWRFSWGSLARGSILHKTFFIITLCFQETKKIS